jgi:hypothetical protein
MNPPINNWPDAGEDIPLKTVLDTCLSADRHFLFRFTTQKTRELTLLIITPNQL